VFAGAADGNVEEPVFFIEAALFDAAPTGEFSFHCFDDEDAVEFETFGLMDGEDADAVFIAELAFEVEAERGDFEGLVEGVHSGDDATEFFEIFEAVFTGLIAAKVFFDETFVEEHVECLEWGLGAAALAPIVDLGGEFDEALTDLSNGLTALFGVDGEELFEFVKDVGSHADVLHGAVGFALGDFQGID